jgi:uncharacterized protein
VIGPSTAALSRNGCCPKQIRRWRSKPVRKSKRAAVPVWRAEANATFVDTGGWFALFVPWDINHAAARAWFDATNQSLTTTDFVIDEMPTLFQQRGERNRGVALGQLLFGRQLATIHRVADQEFLRAWQVFQTFADKDWSLTVFTSKVVMEGIGIATAFSFDHHFRQFGTVTVVPTWP